MRSNKEPEIVDTVWTAGKDQKGSTQHSLDFINA